MGKIFEAALDAVSSMPEQTDEVELSDKDYLKELAQRLWNMPPAYGFDQYDAERVDAIWRKMLPLNPERIN